MTFRQHGRVARLDRPDFVRSRRELRSSVARSSGGSLGCRNRYVLSGTWVTDYSEHIGNTFGYLRGCANAVAGVFQDGRTTAIRGSVARKGEDGRAAAPGR